MDFISAREMKTTSSESKGMGLLLVFFPHHNSRNTSIAVHNPSSSSSSSSPATIRRCRSSGLLLSKARSIISICALLFLTLFLFTLSTFEPSTAYPAVASQTHRRLLLRRDVGDKICHTNVSRFALQGMGTLYLRGTRAMHDLIIAHVGSESTEDDVRLFLRLMHRSGVTSRCDVVFFFTSASSASSFGGVIEEENDSFLRLVGVRRNSNSTNPVDSVWGFDVTRFVKNHKKKETAEPIWGKKSGVHRVGNEPALNKSDTIVLSHGSVVGFDVGELDPENTLSGFMDHVPMSLRRWACYPMLLGRIRHNFKHVMLVNAETSLFLGDPLTRVRNRSPDSVFVFSKQSMKNSDRTQPNSVVNPAILMGGAKGIRELSNAMLTGIVRAAMQHKKKNSVSETVVLSQLVENVHMTKSFRVVTTNESVPEASSLAELRTRNSAASSVKGHDIIQRSNDNHADVSTVIRRHICSSELDSSVYMDC
ncbi:PREDICTED: uncharacterized protein LOC104824440 [Tarenaya hassleriana]|uniref:uncharacterized protein LOC104824440 n=1 Tax=Tarenaya hassleriana TaxID=28532 RepID=UPI00053C5EBD|nr:PREDICTED: uncharacterized protein LOC104824440 [Tarenaya hassleriana]